jgi:rare lipoprotein A
MQSKTQRMSRAKCLATIAIAWSLGAAVSVVSMYATAAPSDTAPALQTSPETSRVKPHLDRSGGRQVGKASFYAARYAGKTMADGTPMQLYSDNAASTTLPLGTTAKVTNLETGRSAVVTIRDRGPYVKGRIVDLSPSTARKIGISRKQGLAKVEVAPLTIPLADGTVKISKMAIAVNQAVTSR